VRARDANDNTDLDFIESVTLNPSAGTASGLSTTFASGIGTYSAINFSTIGTGITLITNSSLPLAGEATSTAFTVN
ncbi:MAG: hypothetical protein ACK5XL_19460, partial [Cyclobacteriaceae bacterium]